MRRRKEFRDLVTANSNLTSSHYWRLVALASVDFCFTIPLAICGVVMDANLGVSPWVSWADTHWGYSRVFQFPRVILYRSPVAIGLFEIARWNTVLCAFVFFGFFGFANEAMENYRLLASTVAKRLGRKRAPPNPPPDQPPAMNFPTDEVPRIPESVLDLVSVRRSSTTGAPESVYPDDALGQV
jgi:pheromone a factor receptor